MASKEKPKRGRGRPQGPANLTAAKLKAILSAMEQGATNAAAAAAGGVSREALQAWIKKGRAATKGTYFDLVAQIEKARSKGELALLATVRAGKRGWQGSAWILERRWRGEYAKRYDDQRRGQIEINKLEAEVDLSKAKADLARKSTEHIGDPVTVVIVDPGAGVSLEELADASPTIAAMKDHNAR